MARRDKYDIIQFPKPLNAIEAARELKDATKAPNIYTAVLAAIVEVTEREKTKKETTA